MQGNYTENLITLSTQQMIDCVPTTAGNGCGSVQSVDDVFSYATKNIVMNETNYKTNGVSGAKCKYDQTKGQVQVTSVSYPMTNNPSTLKSAVV